MWLSPSSYFLRCVLKGLSRRFCDLRCSLASGLYTNIISSIDNFQKKFPGSQILASPVCIPESPHSRAPLATQAHCKPHRADQSLRSFSTRRGVGSPFIAGHRRSGSPFASLSMLHPHAASVGHTRTTRLQTQQTPVRIFVPCGGLRDWWRCFAPPFI
jgi:hypothetical protein